jgi:beta-lactamase class A
MSFGRSRVRASARIAYPVVYQHGNIVPRRKFLGKRVGWFGKSLTLTLVAILMGVTVTMRGLLLETFDVQYSQTNIAETAGQTTPTALAPSFERNIVDLQPVLDKWHKDHPGQRWSVVIKSLDGPSFDASLKPNEVYQSASIYKLFLTLPLMRQVPIERQKYVRVDAGGTKRTVAQCLDMMLRLSDNPCGNGIAEYLGWSKADAYLKEQGYKQTSFLSREGLQTSAGDTAKFLEGLNSGMFKPAEQTAIYTAMSKQVFRQGIPTGCPGCMVADKIGNIDNVLHDAGIVTYSKGKYILVIFSEDNRKYSEIAKLTGQLQQRILDTTK